MQFNALKALAGFQKSRQSSTIDSYQNLSKQKHATGACWVHYRCRWVNELLVMQNMLSDKLIGEWWKIIQNSKFLGLFRAYSLTALAAVTTNDADAVADDGSSDCCCWLLHWIWNWDWRRSSWSYAGNRFGPNSAEAVVAAVDSRCHCPHCSSCSTMDARPTTMKRSRREQLSAQLLPLPSRYRSGRAHGQPSRRSLTASRPKPLTSRLSQCPEEATAKPERCCLY